MTSTEGTRLHEPQPDARRRQDAPAGSPQARFSNAPRPRLRALRRPVFAALYGLGALAFLEACSRAVVAFMAPWLLAQPMDDPSWRLRWLARHPQGLAGYSFDVYDTRRGWALAPDLKGVRVFGDRVLSSNSRGVRGADEHDYERPRALHRALVFGDSFTFGEEVSDDETYPSFLGTMLPDYEVLNMGVQGYGHDQMLLYFREEGHRYHPDLVILGFVGQDMERNLLSFRDFAKPRFELRGGALVLQNTPVAAPAEVLGASRRSLRFFDLLSVVAERIRARATDRESAARRGTSAILDALRADVASAGGTLLLAYLPVGHEIDTPDAPGTGGAFFSEYCAGRGAECVDLRPAFLAEAGGGLALKTVGHWDRREHHIAARVLADHLRDTGQTASRARRQPAKEL